jgi:uncharacterized protein (TIGR02453 family)
MLQPSTIRFLKDLSKNNNKPWFEEHRTPYEFAKKDFEVLIQNVISQFSAKEEDIASLQAKQSVFRINRDVRFSKDKSPYKTNMGASIKRGGKKSVFAGYYFHLEPGKSFAGGGIWMPGPVEMKKIRQEIAYCFDEFNSIIQSKKFKSVYGDLDKDEEISLVNVPKGYDKGEPAADYLKLKSWIATKEIRDTDLRSHTLEKDIVNYFQALQPMIKFLNRALED